MDCRLISLISLSTLNSIFLRPIGGFVPPQIFDTEQIKKFTHNFVNTLKLISVPKILCIFFVIPIFNIGMKYFKIRYKVLYNAHVLGITKFTLSILLILKKTGRIYTTFGPYPGRRGPERTYGGCTSFRTDGIGWVAVCGENNCGKHLSEKSTSQN